MKKTAITMVAMLLLIGFSALSTAEHGAGPDRNATFVGSTSTDHDLNDACANALDEDECPVRIIQGIISITCDYTDDSADPAGLYDGIGGVSFCEIPMGATFTLQYAEAQGLGARGSVTCPKSDGTLNWNDEFGILEGTEAATFTVPNDCDEDGTHEGNTRVNIFNKAATFSVGGDGDPTIGFIAQGEVTLQL